MYHLSVEQLFCPEGGGMDDPVAEAVAEVAAAEAVAAPADAPAVASAAADTSMTVLREHLVAAHPNAVPELIAGATVAELLASVEAAKAAHTRVAATIAPATPQAPIAAAGAGVRTMTPDMASLSPSAKIHAAISQRGT